MNSYVTSLIYLKASFTSFTLKSLASLLGKDVWMQSTTGPCHYVIVVLLRLQQTYSDSSPDRRVYLPIPSGCLFGASMLRVFNNRHGSQDRAGLGAFVDSAPARVWRRRFGGEVDVEVRHDGPEIAGIARHQYQ
jgi:hypothetical protein